MPPVPSQGQAQVILDEEAIIPTTITQNSSSRSDSDKQQQTVAVAPFIPTTASPEHESNRENSSIPHEDKAIQSDDGAQEAETQSQSNIPAADEFIPLILLSTEDSEKNHPDEAGDTTANDANTCIPLITELGIKD
jgi:hypothetical protein